MKPWILLIALAVCGWSEEAVAFVKKTAGSVLVTRAGVTLNLQSGLPLYRGDRIVTGTPGSAGIVFNDGTRLSLGPSTRIDLNDYVFDPSNRNFLFDLAIPQGSTLFESGKIGKLAPKSVKIRVPQGIIGIRGTKFIVEAR